MVFIRKSRGVETDLEVTCSVLVVGDGEGMAEHSLSHRPRQISTLQVMYTCALSGNLNAFTTLYKIRSAPEFSNTVRLFSQSPISFRFTGQPSLPVSWIFVVAGSSKYSESYAQQSCAFTSNLFSPLSLKNIKMLKGSPIWVMPSSGRVFGYLPDLISIQQFTLLVSCPFSTASIPTENGWKLIDFLYESSQAQLILRALSQTSWTKGSIWTIITFSAELISVFLFVTNCVAHPPVGTVKVYLSKAPPGSTYLGSTIHDEACKIST